MGEKRRGEAKKDFSMKTKASVRVGGIEVAKKDFLLWAILKCANRDTQSPFILGWGCWENKGVGCIGAGPCYFGLTWGPKLKDLPAHKKGVKSSPSSPPLESGKEVLV